MNALDLPIEVRKPSSALVARTRSSQAVDLPPGVYYVTTRLPAGQQITRSVDLTGGSRQLRLEPDPEDAGDHEWDEQRHFLDPARPAAMARGRAEWAAPEEAAPAPGTLDAAPPPAGAGAESALVEGRGALRVFSGNLLLGPGTLEAATVVLRLQQFEAGRVVYLGVQASSPVVVQLLEVGSAALNQVVPPGARLAVSHRPTPEIKAGSLFKLEAFTRNPIANLQLRYCRQGAYRRAGSAAESERLLYEKIDDPVAAAIGAYSLFRIGALERLHDWTANLDAMFPWLPDGAAIRGEHLARLGRHVEALAAFARLPERGLPVVADGLFYAVERMKLYSRLSPERSEGVGVEQARAVLAKLERFAGVVHQQRPLTSFPGVDPARPDARLLRAGEAFPGMLQLDWLVAPSAPGPGTDPPPAASARSA